MNNKFIASIVIFASLFSLQSFASDSQEKLYLIQMLNQLDTLKPLIVSASKEQNKNTRIQFHYYAYRDAGGNLHNGLMEDISEIRKGIIDQLNQVGSEPRQFKPIKDDYIDNSQMKINGEQQ